MAFDLDPNYKQVPERIADFKALYPTGSLRCLNPEKPYSIEVIDGQTFIVYAAAAYRTPDDPAPGIGLAWEPVPGKTPYTRLSELQNAETSAWGRAIVAVLASESKSVASAEDVRNRQADQRAPERPVLAGWDSLDEQDAAHNDFTETVKACSDEVQDVVRTYRKNSGFPWPMPREQLDDLLEQLAAAQTVRIPDNPEFDVDEPTADEKRKARAEQVANESGLTEKQRLLAKAEDIGEKARKRKGAPADPALAAAGDKP